MFTMRLCCICLLLSWCSLTLVLAQQRKLLFSQIIFRHGERAPVKAYPKDPNPPESWPEGLGKLTLLGKKQHFELGKVLRSMYENFTTSDPNEIMVWSTYFDRCRRGAEATIASFYAPTSQWKFDPNVEWQPIPIHYLPRKVDKYLAMDCPCPLVSKVVDEYSNVQQHRELTDEHKDLTEKLIAHFGIPIIDIRQYVYMYDIIMAEKDNGLVVPAWTETYWQEWQDLSDLILLKCLSFSPLLPRLRSGSFVQLLIDNMKKKINGTTPQLKFQVFSAHDLNLATLMISLNIYNRKRPTYCSALIFELHQDESKHSNFVRILYLNDSNKPEFGRQAPHVLTLAGCSEFCPLEFFIDYTKDLIPEDWNLECQLDKPHYENVTQSVSRVWVSVIIGVLITLALIVIKTRWKRKSTIQRKRF